MKKTVHKIKVIISISILSVLFIFIISENIFKTNRRLCYSDIEKIPENKVGLLLGTSKYLKGGKQNLFYKNRIDAAAKLYFSGKIKYIIASGDNRRKNYNEPKIMKKDLIKKGIPENKIFADYAGFRTFDSVVRSKEVFGQNSITIISQRFHNLRAVFIAKHFGINAVAYNAKEVTGINGTKIRFRELFARVKALLDIYILKTKPKFLGEKIHLD
ncbi:MAG: vancomycin high temperature exclusion protein [Chlorobi bacterium]|nr:vancomycin high temperature exclusion protein [Chlorobiota bacterium]